MKYFYCLCCGKQLIRLEAIDPYSENTYDYWCDDCNIDIIVEDNEGKLQKKMEEES